MVVLPLGASAQESIHFFEAPTMLESSTAVMPSPSLTTWVTPNGVSVMRMIGSVTPPRVPTYWIAAAATSAWPIPVNGNCVNIT